MKKFAFCWSNGKMTNGKMDYVWNVNKEENYLTEILNLISSHLIQDASN